MNSKIKDFIFSFSLALFAGLGTLFLFQQLFKDKGNVDNIVKSEQLESGRSRVAPRVQEVHRPLDLEIDFLDTKPAHIVETNTLLETDYARYVFSTDGASIKELDIKHSVDGKDILLKTVNALGKEDRCLLVAFDEKTPFYYSLTNKEESADAIILNYKADFDGGVINKKFIVFKHSCKVDLVIDVVPTQALVEPIRLRIFYPSPSVFDSTDSVQGIFNEGNSVSKKALTTLLQRYWEIPSIFGLEDRYFVNAMVEDLNTFAQRGYYKSSGINLFFSILEGPAIKEKSSWSLSFYFGPKKSSTLYAVDPKLEQTLEYGYMAPLSKPLLAVLIFFYKFFHNYGVAIILLTILIKLLLLPFTIKGEQSMKKRLDFQRKLQYIQQKYKHDKEALAQARTELLQKHGMMDMAGCLPLLLQLPIFFALNRVLSNAIELYQAPFLWIPNLSAKDPYFILPVLIGVSMIAHSASTSTDPRQKLSTYAVALLFSAFSAGLPAGLSLFIFVSAVTTVLQTKFYTLISKNA